MKAIRSLNWFAIAAIIFTVSMFVTVLLDTVPDFFVLPLGLTAIVCAIMNLNWVIETIWLGALGRREVKKK